MMRGKLPPSEHNIIDVKVLIKDNNSSLFKVGLESNVTLSHNMPFLMILRTFELK